MALAIGPTDVVRRVGSYVLLHPPAGDVGEVLTSRSAEWQTAFTQATLRAEAAEADIGLLGPIWWELWQRLRRLQRNGALHPDCTRADYLVLMVRGLLFSGSIVRAVRKDPQLAEHSIWALFEPAPPVQKALLGSEFLTYVNGRGEEPVALLDDVVSISSPNSDRLRVEIEAWLVLRRRLIGPGGREPKASKARGPNQIVSCSVNGVDVRRFEIGQQTRNPWSNQLQPCAGNETNVPHPPKLMAHGVAPPNHRIGLDHGRFVACRCDLGCCLPAVRVDDCKVIHRGICSVVVQLYLRTECGTNHRTREKLVVVLCGAAFHSHQPDSAQAQAQMRLAWPTSATPGLVRDMHRETPSILPCLICPRMRLVLTRSETPDRCRTGVCHAADSGHADHQPIRFHCHMNHASAASPPSRYTWWIRAIVPAADPRQPTAV